MLCLSKAVGSWRDSCNSDYLAWLMDACACVSCTERHILARARCKSGSLMRLSFNEVRCFGVWTKSVWVQWHGEERVYWGSRGKLTMFDCNNLAHQQLIKCCFSLSLCYNVCLQPCFHLCSWHFLDGRRLWDHAIIFARWQHPAVGRGAEWDILCLLALVVSGFTSSRVSMPSKFSDWLIERLSWIYRMSPCSLLHFRYIAQVECRKHTGML